MVRLFERLLGVISGHKPRNSYALSTKVGRLLRPVLEDQVNLGFVDPCRSRWNMTTAMTASCVRSISAMRGSA
jgi:hypothetical protein